jgi:hypothetical protein
MLPDEQAVQEPGSRRASPGKLLIGYVLGAAADAMCFVIAMKMGGEWWLNVLICLFGSIVGWCVGMWLSPLDPFERHEFGDYAKALSAFIGGFLIAKLDLMFATAVTVQAVSTIAFVGRALLFGTTFGVAFQFTFAGRRYS